jgi:hypothetical protein
MVKAIVGLINGMGMVFNCNVAQRYNGAKHVNPNLQGFWESYDVILSNFKYLHL